MREFASPTGAPLDTARLVAATAGHGLRSAKLQTPNFLDSLVGSASVRFAGSRGRLSEGHRPMGGIQQGWNGCFIDWRLEKPVMRGRNVRGMQL